MTPHWHDLPAPDLDVRRLHDLLALRVAVFVVEQACAYQEIDGRDLDEGTRHLWATDGGEILAYARLLSPDEHDVAHIGRVIVAPAGRGRGLAHDLMRRAVASARATWPAAGLALSAQAHLQGFYAAHGFEPRGEVYDEDGIDHIDMVFTA